MSVKKKVLCIVIAIVVVFSLAVAAGFGFAWYQNNHIFVEGEAYPIHAESLDLRGEDISFDHYDTVHAQLPYCEILWDVPFQNGKYSSDTQTISVTSLTAEDVEILLNYFPDLTALNAVGCHDYEMLEIFQTQRTDCQVTYEVDLGGKAVANDIGELTLEVGEYDYETLITNLQFLPQLQSLTLRMPELSLEQIEQLKQTYSEMAVSCTVELLGQEYDTETTQLDLSALTSADVEAAAEKLAMLPGLTTVELADAQGASQLTMEEAKLLMDAAPQASFHYVFDFYGETVSTTDEEVYIKDQEIGDEGADQVRLALDMMENCRRFVLDNCQISDETMAQIREEYREKTKVVWRVSFGKGSALTDVEVIYAAFDLRDSNVAGLYYCEDARFIDMGHNEWLTTAEFVSGMKSLEYVILSGSLVKDLTPFSNCANLKLLEIAFCEQVEDLTPLAQCKNLQMLNISNTHVKDLSPLDELDMTYLCARLNPNGGSRIPSDEQTRFQEQHPDCWSSFTGSQPYGSGWRYDEDQITPLPHYSLMATAFQYPDPPFNTGWYLADVGIELEDLSTETAQEDSAEPTEETQPEETQSEETEASQENSQTDDQE